MFHWKSFYLAGNALNFTQDVSIYSSQKQKACGIVFSRSSKGSSPVIVASLNSQKAVGSSSVQTTKCRSLVLSLVIGVVETTKTNIFIVFDDSSMHFCHVLCQ